MSALYTKDFSYKGHTIRISVHADEDMREPWKEHDDHGIVSNWERRDKQPGEMILCQDRGLKRFYDFAATMKLAIRDSWGLSPENIAKLETMLGRKPTKGDICHASVMADFEHLRAWCNGDWSWLGYTTEIETPDGDTIDGDSCWGYDDAKYMLSEALDNAKRTVQDLRDDKATRLKLARFESKESAYLACADIATV